MKVTFALWNTKPETGLFAMNSFGGGLFNNPLNTDVETVNEEPRFCRGSFSYLIGR